MAAFLRLYCRLCAFSEAASAGGRPFIPSLPLSLSRARGRRDARDARRNLKSRLPKSIHSARRPRPLETRDMFRAFERARDDARRANSLEEEEDDDDARIEEKLTDE